MHKSRLALHLLYTGSLAHPSRVGRTTSGKDCEWEGLLHQQAGGSRDETVTENATLGIRDITTTLQAAGCTDERVISTVLPSLCVPAESDVGVVHRKSVTVLRGGSMTEMDYERF